VTVLGPGPAVLAVDGNATSRGFHVTNGVTALISGLTITNGIGNGGIGGGIYNDHSTLTVSNCAITGNAVGSGGGGGGICNRHSTLTVVNSTLNGNTASSSYGGAIFNDGSGGVAMLTLLGCTLSGNNAYLGGGIYNDGESSGNGTVNATNSTFSGNSATAGAGVYDDGTAGGNVTLTVCASTFNGNSLGNGVSIFNTGTNATVQLEDTILNALGSPGANIDNPIGQVISHGYNLCSDNGGGYLTNSTDLINLNPELGPLANNGGPTLTHALLAGSPAIDKGNSFGLTTDQRCEPRPFDWPSVANAAGGDGSDIGAVEVGQPTLSIQYAGNAAVLSWPGYYGSFSVQTNGNLAVPGGWGNAPGTPAVVGTQYQQTNSPIAGNQFFRLKSN
jgi:hypothetical protein